MLVLVLLFNKKVKDAFISILISIAFGFLLDYFTARTFSWSLDIEYRILYYVLGFVLMSFGASLFVKCTIPVLPMDTFVIHISNFYNIKLKIIRTTIDISFVVITIIISLFFFKEIRTVGIGTLMLALFMGSFMNIMLKFIDRYINIY